LIANATIWAGSAKGNGTIEALKSKELKALETENFNGYSLSQFRYQGTPATCPAQKWRLELTWVLRARFWGLNRKLDIVIGKRRSYRYCDVANLFGRSRGNEAVGRFL